MSVAKTNSTSYSTSTRGHGLTKQLDNQLRVETPENISFQYQLAGPFRRFAAYLLDVLISLGGFGILVIAMWMLIGLLIRPFAMNTALQPLVDAIGGMANAFMLVGAFFVFWFYGAYMETYYNGRTFGKMITGLRVTSTDGSAINAGKATLRNFFRWLDAMPSITPAFAFGIADWNFPPLPLFAVGLVTMLISRKYQRAGDLVAGTIVIVEEREFTYSLAQFEDARVAQLAEHIPNDFNVSASMATALAEYVDRRRFLPYQRVAEVAGHLGELLVDRFDMPKDTNHDLLLCSLYYKIYIDNHDDLASSNPVDIVLPGNAPLQNPFAAETVIATEDSAAEIAYISDIEVVSRSESENRTENESEKAEDVNP